MPSTGRPAAVRFDQIDVLRGLVICSVVLLHARQRFGQTLNASGVALPDWPYVIPVAYNHNVLTIFFAISGFLITYISIRRFGSLEQLEPTAFYRMRFARIAPFLLLLLLVLSALDLAHVRDFVIDPHQASLAHALFAVLTFHMNWLEATRGTFPLAWEILWSLSVEEVFYLFFPLICLALCRWMHRKSLFSAVLVIFVLIGPFARALANPHSSWGTKGYLSCMDAIAMGCLTALLADYIVRRGGTGKIKLLPLQLAGSFMALFIALCPRWISLGFISRWGLEASILSFGVCLITFASALRNKTGSRWTEPLRFMGRYIYEAYLVHAFVVIWVIDLYLKVRRGPITLWYVAIFFVTAAIAWLCAHYFSEPLNKRLRTRRLQPLSAMPALSESPQPVYRRATERAASQHGANPVPGEGTP